uniref:PLD phosphodiesterase domain-containing protein n=1 Tax=Parastrongyloides trichosuri TaxID=131310 RepID=A0A0N4ZQ89_PARTI
MNESEKYSIKGCTQDGRADMTNFEMDLFDTRMNSYNIDKEESEECCKNSFIKPACLPISIVCFFILMVIIFPLLNDEGYDTSTKNYERTGICMDSCKITIIESIPTNLTYDKVKHMSTYDAWNKLLDMSTKSIDISVLYWNLREKEYKKFPTCDKGRNIFNKLKKKASNGINFRIAQNLPSKDFPQDDSIELSKNPNFVVRSLNFSKLLGSGVLHTKFWIVDQKHIYIGSANMDWKSLTEVKELGVLIEDCSCLAHDLHKIFTVYWTLGGEESFIPKRWPIYLRTHFNYENPILLKLNSTPSTAFFSSSPPEFSPKGRQNDSDAILDVFDGADIYAKVAVMDYLPETLYMGEGKNFFWGDIDYKIRETIYRGINVKLLISQWDHTKNDTIPYLKSLLQMNNASIKGKIEVKLFKVPSTEDQKKIPYARVNHNKYLVTDQHALIGTSNWVGDYFITTAGVSLIIGKDNGNIGNTIIEELNNVFDRDWNSKYSTSLFL